MAYRLLKTVQKLENQFLSNTKNATILRNCSVSTNFGTWQSQHQQLRRFVTSVLACSHFTMQLSRDLRHSRCQMQVCIHCSPNIGNCSRRRRQKGLENTTTKTPIRKKQMTHPRSRTIKSSARKQKCSRKNSKSLKRKSIECFLRRRQRAATAAAAVKDDQLAVAKIAESTIRLGLVLRH